MLAVTYFTQQLLFNGMVSGLVIGLIAMGIVLVYRSTRVINFAVGNIGLLGSALFPLLVVNYSWPFWLALITSLAVGTAGGAIIELVVVRRLFDAPRVILLVATVGVAQLCQGIVLAYPEISDGGARYPSAINHIFEDVAGLRQIRGPQLMILLVVPAIAVVLAYVLNRTTFGKAVAASADNPRLARLSTVNPKWVSTAVWVIAGFLATISMILLSANAGGTSGFTQVGASTLARAMVAALLAGMISFPRAVLAGVAIGVAEAIFTFNASDPTAPTWLRDGALIDFTLFLLVVGAVIIQSRGRAPAEGAFSFAPKAPPIPEAVRSVWWIGRLPQLVAAVALVVAIVGPLLIDENARLRTYALIVGFAIVGLSLSVITGWSGQLSLAQMAFAGLGATLAAAFSRGIEMDVWFLDFEAPAVPFVLSMPVAALVVALIAAIIGVGALRVRGLLLAISTFLFALAFERYLIKRPLLSGNEEQTLRYRRGELFGMDLDPERRYYYYALAILVIVSAVAIRIRRYGAGRRIIAVRDNADTAAAYTVTPSQTKLSAFALAGGIAGLGGAVIAGAQTRVSINETIFDVDGSLQIVGIAVIGGIGSVVGPIIGALWVRGIPAIFDDNAVAGLFSSSIGLLLVLMYLPGGLVQIGHSIRTALVRVAERRLGDITPVKSGTEAASLRRQENEPMEVPLRASDMTVRFGGNVAVDATSIEVRANEIIGLIGTNGAGKTTLMNAISGHVPADGRVEILGRDMSGTPTPARAQAGLGRTFQSAALFPELSVRETVMVALEARERSPLVATALHLPPSYRIERTKRTDAAELIDFLGLGRYADHYVSDLSTGTRRIVELAGLLALDARVLCLDEPTAGLAQRETEAFGPLLTSIRAELSAAMIVIEHDMPLIASISDRLYCMEAGRVIAEGDPEAVRSDPLVIASYLGTDSRAIDRSNS